MYEFCNEKKKKKKKKKKGARWEEKNVRKIDETRAVNGPQNWIVPLITQPWAWSSTAARSEFDSRSSHSLSRVREASTSAVKISMERGVISNGGGDSPPYRSVRNSITRS
jgi:hypothetical protein